jgi:hypothetical protein
LETYTKAKDLVENQDFEKQKRQVLRKLTDAMIDKPIVGMINRFNALPCCFTLQSCYGHFLYKGQQEMYNFEPLPLTAPNSKIEYRIAYIAFCIDINESGRELLANLKHIISIDPQNIQFGSAEWFWKRQVNSYVLQVEPDRFKYQDKAIMEHGEALHIESTRNTFFDELNKII